MPHGQSGTPVGTIINRHKVPFDPVVFHQAQDTDLIGGNLVYQDTSNGLKVVPLSGVNASRIMVIAFDSLNNPAALGIKRLDCYKSGSRVVLKCGTGALAIIPVNSNIKYSSTIVGAIELLLADDVDFTKENIGIYKGHLGESTGINNPPTPSADSEDNLVCDLI